MLKEADPTQAFSWQRQLFRIVASRFAADTSDAETRQRFVEVLPSYAENIPYLTALGDLKPERINNYFDKALKDIERYYHALLDSLPQCFPASVLEEIVVFAGDHIVLTAKEIRKKLTEVKEEKAADPIKVIEDRTRKSRVSLTRVNIPNLSSE